MNIYRLNDIEWWMAHSLEEAIATAMEDTGCSREEVYDGDYPDALGAAELDALKFCDREPSEDEMTFANWRCECGAIADGNCRWNGDAYEHSHGQAGHVVMKDTTVRTFREELAERIAAGSGPEIFASNEI